MREDAEQDYFDSQIAPLLGDEIEYVGELDEAEKYQLLGEAIAMLNPIQWPEPFGLVMIEALACGTPVVSTSVGSVPEIIDHGTTGYVDDSQTGQQYVLLKKWWSEERAGSVRVVRRKTWPVVRSPWRCSARSTCWVAS